MAPRRERSYGYRDVVDRIRDEVDYRQLRDVEVCRAVGISKDQWSRKMRVNEKGTGGRGTSFTLEELARIADKFQAFPGWPFVSKATLHDYIRSLDPERLRSVLDRKTHDWGA